MKENMTIVGFGDSITQAVEVTPDKNWLNLLKAMLTERYPQTQWTLINAGVGGNTSREGLARMDNDVLAHRPDLVLIEFGGNDATHEEARSVSLEEYQANLRAMLERLKSISARAVLVMFPPVIDEWHAWGKLPHYAPWKGLDGCVEQYRAITRQFAQSETLPLADIDAALRLACKKQKTEQFIRPCGVHMTEAGNQVIAKTVFETLTTCNVF